MDVQAVLPRQIHPATLPCASQHRFHLMQRLTEPHHGGAALRPQRLGHAVRGLRFAVPQPLARPQPQHGAVGQAPRVGTPSTRHVAAGPAAVAAIGDGRWACEDLDLTTWLREIFNSSVEHVE